MSEGNEGNDDSQAPGGRSIDDIFKDFGDSEEAARERAEEREGWEEGLKEEETEETAEEETEGEREQKLEIERIAALTGGRATDAYCTHGEGVDMMIEALRSAPKKDKKGEGDE